MYVVFCVLDKSCGVIWFVLGVTYEGEISKNLKIKSVSLTVYFLIYQGQMIDA